MSGWDVSTGGGGGGGVSDHGALTGLADDDHPAYLEADPAAFVEPTTATPEALADALIAAGLMLPA